ncbi:NAC domain-containing protein 71-like isoform X2 [Hibiscus syriacus]|uniref:NAC domain-containing protein 71-like isoform X2 n=1 Tax=Hibiscus syriacus TaxID=106335 RepID=UPI001923E0C8|nr:NAC domain-containing protein 71-like isoform X2 [Hibiscus syriacus]
MNIVKGFRFHPTDEELIEFLQIKTSDRDSLVQIIDEVPDICQWEPWQLAESSKLQAGDRLWYFIYSPKYKYRNSKRINRTARRGYWKPTGNARKVIDPKTGELIGTKKTLVYYKGQCNDGNKIKTCWVMHEYELKADPNSIDTDHKTFNLCKLKKRVDVLSTDAGQPGQHNEGYGVRDRSGSVDSCAGERSNRHNMVTEDAISDLSSLETLHLKERLKECNGPEDNNGVQKLYNTLEKDDKSCNSVLIDGDDEIITMERSASELFEVPSSFELPLADNNLTPMDLSYYNGLSFDELFKEPEATNDSNWIQDQYITNMEDEFLNSIFVENEAFSWPCLGVMEPSDSMEKPRKKPRLLHESHAETADAQVGGNITISSVTKS